MKIIDKKKMSRWAYYQCKNGNDSPEIRDLITDSFWALFNSKRYRRDVE